MRTAAPKYNWNLSRRLPGPKAVELLRLLVEEEGHLTSELDRAGYMSVSNLSQLRKAGWDAETAREAMRAYVRGSMRRRRGSPLDAPVRPMGVPVLTTVLAGLSISNDTGCWTLPTRALGAFGYAVLQDPSTNERVKLHIWAAKSSSWTVEGQHHFETCAEPVVHHRCRNRACFRPEHLLVLENDDVHRQLHVREAAERGESPVGASGEVHYAYRSHCKRGHALHGPGAERRSNGDCGYCKRINANFQAEREGKVKPGAGARSEAREARQYAEALLRDQARRDAS